MQKELISEKEIILSNPQCDLYESDEDVNLFMAGQGSGKTHVAGVVSYKFVSAFPNARGLIAANTYDQLNRSTMFRIREVWKDLFGLTEYKQDNPEGDYVVGVRPPQGFVTKNHNFDTYHNIISFITGTVIYIGSLDNYKSLDGMEVGWALLDETKDTRQQAVEEVILGRLRQRGVFNSKGVEYNPLFIFTSPAKVPWINEWFKLDQHEEEIMARIFDQEDYFVNIDNGRLVTISSVYMNRDNLPASYIPRQLRNLPSHLHDMLIYGSPFARSGGEFYKQFDRKIHVLRKEWVDMYDRDEPLHITFDFNVSPYVTLLVWHIKDKTATQIDEICLSSPDNTTRKACKEFKRRYQSHVSGLFVYGDPSGKARSTRDEEGADDFKIIESELYSYRPITRVPDAAPSVIMRGNFINTVFESNFAGIKVLIGVNCPKTIADYTFTKENSEGKKYKKKIIDPKTKVTFEEFGHCSDANDYLLTEAFRSEYLDYQAPPDDGIERTFGTISQSKNKF